MPMLSRNDFEQLAAESYGRVYGWSMGESTPVYSYSRMDKCPELSYRACYLSVK